MKTIAIALATLISTSAVATNLNTIEYVNSNSIATFNEENGYWGMPTNYIHKDFYDNLVDYVDFTTYVYEKDDEVNGYWGDISTVYNDPTVLYHDTNVEGKACNDTTVEVKVFNEENGYW